MRILTEYTAAWPERVLHVSYERFTREPASELQRICRFLGEDAGQISLPEDWIHPEKNRYADALTREEMALVIEKCEPFWSRFGYRIDAGETHGS